MPTPKPPVKVETEFTYTNKFSNRTIVFTPKADEVVVTFVPGTSETATLDTATATSFSISQGVNPEFGFAVLKVNPGQDMAAAADALMAHPNVSNTLPVMIDDENLVRYFLPDEFTVQFKPEVSKESAEKIIADKGSLVVAEQRTPGYYTLAVPEGEGLFGTLRQFSELDEVLFAEPSEAGFNDALAYLPDDPDFPKLWGLRNTGQPVNGVVGTSDCDIDATEAWDFTRGDPDVIVAVVDTGADLNHPELAGNLLPRGSEDWDFAETADLIPDDTDGHGTHVAGTVAAIDNALGVIGVAPRCRLMPLRINLATGMNQNRADAINFVAGHAAANPSRRYVINCSWKMNGDHAGVHSAIINAVNANVVVVFAAGNSNLDIGVTPFYPSIYSEVISVAATDQSDRRAYFSNYGAPVDVSAPGVNIYSSFPDDTFTFLDGTSMASPHVAGLAALVWSRNRALSSAQVRQIIETSCDNIDAHNPGFAGKLGRGRINAFRALSQTPLPPVSFQLLRRLRFPQANAGSSTGLSFARAIRINGSRRSALLFLTQQAGAERVYYLHPHTGVVIGSVLPQNNFTIGSLEWDGNSIRVANVTVGAGAINIIDPLNGAQLGSLPAPAGRGEGLTYDGRFLYYSTETRIHKIDPTTGAVVHSFPPPGGACRALAFGRGYLFSGNSAAGTITIFDPNTLAIRGLIAAPGSGSERVEGLAFNPTANELFVANQSENLIYVGVVSL